MLSKPRPFIVAYGEEDFFLDQAIGAARAWSGRSSLYLDGDGLDVGEFVEVCESRAFGGDDRLIILDNANELKGDKGDKMLKAFVEAKDPEDLSVVVVAVIRSAKLPDVWGGAAVKGSLQHFPKFKPWEIDKVKKAVLEEADRLKLTLHKDAVDSLVFFLGPNLSLIASELRKLFWLVGEGGLVQRHHVVSIVSPSMPAEPFEVADAAASKNAKKALNLVSLLYKDLGDGVSVPITAALLKLVERLIIARQMLDKGDSSDIIAVRFEMHRVRVERYLLPMARKHTVSELRNHMQNLCRLDAQVKGAAASKQTLVELAVLSIAAA